MFTPFGVLCGVLMLVSVTVTVGAVDLPDPLEFADGSKVTSVKAWEEKRREEVLELFRGHIYGRNPVGRPADLRFDSLEEETPVFDGAAVRRRVRIAYAGPRGESGFTLTVYYPAKGVIKGCFLMIVNRSPRIISQAEVTPVEFWPVRDLIERGYAAAAFHNGEVAPDRKESAFTSGVFSVFDPEDEPRSGDAWGVIAAWAWGASRALDCLQEQPRLKGVPLAVAGHSRGGKAALWCGAQDIRVALTVSNDSGTAGAALARVSTGESVRKINETFPHWFAANYHGYADREAALPVDQHALIGLIAPRLAYVASATDDATACPPAEFRACVEAAPVYALYGLAGVGATEFPEAGKSLHDDAIGYHLRAGEHDLRREDWARFMDFADLKFPELRKR